MWAKGTPEPSLKPVPPLHKNSFGSVTLETRRLYPGKLFLKQLSQTVLHGVNLESQLVHPICYELWPSHLLKPNLACLFAWRVKRWMQFVNIIWFNMMTNDFQKKLWIGFVRVIISEAWLRRGSFVCLDQCSSAGPQLVLGFSRINSRQLHFTS